MPKVRPLRPTEAKRSLAHRLAPRVDRLRQLSTRFGLRSRRVFLVWTRYTGAERGEGREVEVARLELLPTPKVSDLTALSRNPFSAGVLPVGIIRVDEISATLAEETLRGRVLPAAVEEGSAIDEPYDFFYEVVEDDRESPEPARMRFRLYAGPTRREGFVCWALLLERASEDRAPDGASRWVGNNGGDE